MADRKRALRRAALARRAGLSGPEQALAGRALAGHAVRLAARLRCDVVTAYAAVEPEPPTMAALEALRAAGVTVLLPVITGRALDWAPYEGSASLARTGLGLLEPTAGRLGVDAIATAGLVLAPAVLVDRAGHRLGRGGGFYDRALARTGALAVAVVHDEEVVDELPHEPHDVVVAGALTPSGLTDLGGLTHLGGPPDP
ncbi:MAG: 5-formyltetrahydrofolate cyclo-ligase [Frankiaceae bacterium]